MAIIETKCFSGKKPLVLPDAADVETVAIDVEFPATAPSVGDLIRLCDLPPYTKVLDWALIFPDVDSNGTPTLAMSLGVENAGGTDLGSEVWGTGLTAGQSTTLVRNTTSLAAQGDSSVQRRIDLKVTTAAATYAGSGKVGQVLLQLQG